MPARSSPGSITLQLTPEERWTLHHVLLHRIERETAADDATSIDPPRLAVFRAFETLDGGGSRFTVEELEAIEDLLAEYHHRTTWWEVERPRIERLLHRVANALGGVTHARAE